jgi:hypothetical protein
VRFRGESPRQVSAEDVSVRTGLCSLDGEPGPRKKLLCLSIKWQGGCQGFFCAYGGFVKRVEGLWESGEGRGRKGDRAEEKVQRVHPRPISLADRHRGQDQGLVLPHTPGANWYVAFSWRLCSVREKIGRRS